MPAEIGPLASDPKRQASDKFSGYVYQAYHSLKQWISLQDGEVLFLECAEDIDLISENGAVVTQVKNTAKPVTLNSSDVIDSISNYWTLRLKELGKIKFVFLTTSERSHEKTKPFANNKGLDYWDACKQGADIEPLKNFLLNLASLSEPVKSFLSQKTNEEIREYLIKPIEWVTSQPDITFLEREIKDLLIQYGDRHKFFANESIRAFEHLLNKVFDAMRKDALNERRLNKSDFIYGFQECLTETVSSAQIRQMRSSSLDGIKEIIRALSSQGQPSNYFFINDRVLDPKVVDEKQFVIRAELRKKGSSILTKSPMLVITGSTGMGKTNLSLQLIVGELSSWKITSFRGLKGLQIKEALSSVYAYCLGDAKNFILDDLDFGEGFSLYEEAFERLITFLKESNKKIIITSHKPIPPSMGLRLDISKEIELSIPKFNQEEITIFLKNYSCPAEDVDLWRRELEFTTGLHPQLVHARIKRLEQGGWSKKDAFSQTDELDQIRQEKMTTLLSEIPVKELRNFLLRLTILRDVFKLKNAFSLASFPYKIDNPGLFFNQLVGPYIEQIGNNSYRVSPLLEDAHVNNFSDVEIASLHETAGCSYVDKTLTPSSLSNIFHHGLMGKSAKLIIYGLFAFQGIDESKRDWIYPYLNWLTLVNIEVRTRAFEDDEITSSMLRQAQFNIAIHNKNSRHALKIIDAWFDEIKHPTGRSVMPKNLKEEEVPSLMFFNAVFLVEDINFSISKCVEWLVFAYASFQTPPKMFVLFEKQNKYKDLSWKNCITQLILIKRINALNIKDFFNLLSALEGAADVLNAINSDNILSRAIVDNIWINESTKERPDWTHIATLIQGLNSLPVLEKALNLRALLFRAIAIIEKEYLNNSTGAQKAIQVAIAQIGDHPELLNYQAKIAFLDKDHERAFKIWGQSLPKLAKYDQSMVLSFAYRDASVSASYAGDWKMARVYSKKAMLIAHKQGERVFELQCLADYGYQLWKDGLFSESLKTFVKVLEKLPSLPSPNDDLRVLGLFKMVSTTLLFFKKLTNNEKTKTDYIEPYPGVFSQLNFSPELKKLPIPPYEALLTFPAEIEHDLQIGESIFNKLMKSYTSLPLLFQADVRKIQIRKILKSRKPSGIVKLVVDFFVITRVCMTTTDLHITKRALTKADFEAVILPYGSAITQLVAFSLTPFLEENSFKDLPLSVLDTEAASSGLDKSLVWKQFMNLISKLDISSSLETLRNQNADQSLRIVAGLYILKNDTHRDNLMYASGFLAVIIQEGSIFFKELEDSFTNMIVSKWREIANQLRQYNPDSCKNVLTECDNGEGTGMKKVAKIILAANQLSFQNIESIRDKLEAIANG